MVASVKLENWRYPTEESKKRYMNKWLIKGLNNKCRKEMKRRRWERKINCWPEVMIKQIIKITKKENKNIENMTK